MCKSYKVSAVYIPVDPEDEEDSTDKSPEASIVKWVKTESVISAMYKESPYIIQGKQFFVILLHHQLSFSFLSSSYTCICLFDIIIFKA